MTDPFQRAAKHAAHVARPREKEQCDGIDGLVLRVLLEVILRVMVVVLVLVLDY